MNRRTILKLGGIAAMAAAGGAGALKAIRHITGAGDVIVYPSPILRTVAAPVRQIDTKTVSICRLLTATVRYYSLTGFFSRAFIGRGLSAPQLGIRRRVAVCGIRGRLRVLVNPRVVAEKGGHAGYESCLSLPAHSPGLVRRPGFIELVYTALDGGRKRLKAAGEYAAVLAHEIDHLNGILYIDRI